MIDYIKIQDFFKNLDFTVSIKKINKLKKITETVISINGEEVNAEYTREVRPQQLPLLKKMKKLSGGELLIVADYITPNAKTELKDSKISYIDSFGNAFIKLEKLKIFIEQGNAKPSYNKHSSLFSKTAGQVIFQFLMKPESVNDRYEDISKRSCVSLGSLAKIFKTLKKEGYLIELDSEKNYQLVKRTDLLEKWITIINEKTLPALKRGYYTFSKFGAFESKESDDTFKSFWGNESGAEIITKGYLKPEKYSLFTTRQKGDLIKKFKMFPNENGEITVYDIFWNNEKSEGELKYEDNNLAAPPLLVYAELIHSGNDRNIETAKIIYNEYIKPNL